jgi:hypothetical protein
VVHIAGAIVWIVGSYYHVYLLDPEYHLLKWIYAAVALWAFDRVTRLARTIWLSLPIFRKADVKKRGILPAEAFLTCEGTLSTCASSRPTPGLRAGAAQRRTSS